jgi:hypothetical protein
MAGSSNSTAPPSPGVQVDFDLNLIPDQSLSLDAVKSVGQSSYNQLFSVQSYSPQMMRQSFLATVTSATQVYFAATGLTSLPPLVISSVGAPTVTGISFLPAPPPPPPDLFLVAGVPIIVVSAVVLSIAAYCYIQKKRRVKVLSKMLSKTIPVNNPLRKENYVEHNIISDADLGFNIMHRNEIVDLESASVSRRNINRSMRRMNDPIGIKTPVKHSMRHLLSKPSVAMSQRKMDVTLAELMQEQEEDEREEMENEDEDGDVLPMSSLDEEMDEEESVDGEDQEDEEIGSEDQYSEYPEEGEASEVEYDEDGQPIDDVETDPGDADGENVDAEADADAVADPSAASNPTTDPAAVPAPAPEPEVKTPKVSEKILSRLQVWEEMLNKRKLGSGNFVSKKKIQEADKDKGKDDPPAMITNPLRLSTSSSIV